MKITNPNCIFQTGSKLNDSLVITAMKKAIVLTRLLEKRTFCFLALVVSLFIFGTVQAQDTIAPTAICKDINVYLDGTGNATIAPADLDSGSTDNSGSVILSVSQTTFDCSDLTGVDQSQPNTGFAAGGQIGAGQSFRAGVSGNLVAISIRAYHYSNAVTAQFKIGAGTNPSTAAVLATENINLGTSMQDYTINFSTSVSLTAGSDYVWWIQGGGAIVTVIDNSLGNPYANGNLWQNTGSGWNPNGGGIDAYFKTYMSTGITLTATDSSGNSDNCVAQVLILDTIPPVASCQNLTIQLNASGNASITANEIDNGSSDNCGVASMSASKTSFNCSNVGSNNVTLTVTDNSSNTAQCASTVTVQDTTGPIVIAGNITVNITSGGTVTVSASQVDSASTDNCSIVSRSLSDSVFTCADAGANAVTLYITDANGNTNSAAATIIINGPPSVSVVIDSTVSCNGNSDGGLTASPTGGTGSYSYSWNNSATTASITGVAAGTYILTVTDNNGCTATASEIITQPAVVTLVVTQSDTQVCAGSPVVLSVSGAEPGDKALNFDGADDYVNISDHADLRPNTGITLTAWVNPTASTGNYGFIFGKEIPQQDYLFAVDASNHLHGRFNTNNGNWNSYTTASAIPYGEWTHVAVTYDNSMVRVYVNGAETDSATWNEPLTLNGSSTPLNIGRRGDALMNFYGAMDEATLWNKALTPSEIEEVMNMDFSSSDSGLMGYWKLDEGSGTTTADETGNGHTGTLTNGPQWVDSYAAIDLSDYQWSPSTGLDVTSGNSVTATIDSNQTYTVTYTNFKGCTSTVQYDLNLSNTCLPVWNGTGNWTDNPYWTRNPSSADSVVIQSGTVTINTTATVNDLTLESGTVLTVEPGNTLTVTGNYINNGGSFHVQSGGAIIFQNEFRKGAVRKLKTFGKIKVLNGSITLGN